MRIIKFAVFNKETNKRIYTNCRESKCIEFIDKQDNKENFEIRHKWFSI